MKKWLIIAAILGLAGFRTLTHGADWYLDADASGANDGTSWTDAWQAFGDIGWASLNAGDTMHVSGGTYAGLMTVGKSGAAGNPIILKASQEVGHNDLVDFANARISSGQNFITFDGSKDDAWWAANITNTPSVAQITNNIGWKVNAGTLNGSAYNHFGSAGVIGITLRGIEFLGSANLGDKHSIRFNADSDSPMGTNLIEYCRLADSGQDGFHCGQGNNNPGWDDVIMRYCIVEEVGDDGIEYVAEGLTLHHNIIRNTLQQRGHPDGLQCVGNFYRVYNNIFFDWHSSHLITQGTAKYIENGLYGNIHIYGNLFYIDDHDLVTTAVEIKWFPNPPPASELENARWEDIRIVNNTMVRSSNGGWTFAKRDNLLTNANMTAITFQNNIIVNSTNGAANCKGDSQGFFYDDADFVFDHNVVAGSTEAILYNDVSYADAEALNAGTIYANNTSSTPSFADYANHDYRLLSVDLVAKDQGTDLTSLSLVGLSTDLWGNTRGADGSWDIGAHEETPAVSDLLLCLDFEDDFSDGQVDDESGNSRHMLRYGFAATPTNWPDRVSPGKAGTYFAEFKPNYGSLYPPGNPSGYIHGDYGAITNLGDNGGLLKITNMTVMLWGRYYDNPNNSILQDHQASFLDGGYTTNGAWHLGRYYSSTFGNTKFYIVTNPPTDRYFMFDAPFGGTDGFPDDCRPFGDSGGWNHYAVTITCASGHAVGEAYYNGVLHDTDTASNITHLTVAPSAIGGPNSFPWLAVGCHQHVATATLDDAENLPNNGWLNGGMDDVRIYNRVLSASEIAAIANIAPQITPSRARNLRIFPSP